MFARDDGRQISIPISDIAFENGKPKTISTPADDELTAWLVYLANQGRLRQTPAAPASTALTLKAAIAGSTGNKLVVNVAPNNAEATKLDVTVTETDVYDGLTFNLAQLDDATSVTKVLGIAGTADGTRPGLVQFVGPKPAAPVELTVAVPGAVVQPQTNKPTINVPSTAANAAPLSFALIARAADAGTVAARWSAAITNLDTTAKTFTLTVGWSKTVTIAGTADLAGLATEMAFAVAITLPTNPALPAVGTTHLSGGAEIAAATKAAATVLANP